MGDRQQFSEGGSLFPLPPSIDYVTLQFVGKTSSFWFKIRSYEHQLLFLLPSRPLFFLVRGGTCTHCSYRLIAYDSNVSVIDFPFYSEKSCDQLWLQLYLGLISGMWRTVGSRCISASFLVSFSLEMFMFDEFIFDAVEMLFVSGNDLTKESTMKTRIWRKDQWGSISVDTNKGP